jgi:hypothetical protein
MNKVALVYSTEFFKGASRAQLNLVKKQFDEMFLISRLLYPHMSLQDDVIKCLSGNPATMEDVAKFGVTNNLDMHAFVQDVRCSAKSSCFLESPRNTEKHDECKVLKTKVDLTACPKFGPRSLFSVLEMNSVLARQVLVMSVGVMDEKTYSSFLVDFYESTLGENQITIQ